MKMENFTLNLSHVLRRCSFIGFIMVSLLYSNEAIAQCPLACNKNVQVSMDDDCQVEITPDMMLEGQGTNPACNYYVVVLGPNNKPVADSVTVTKAHIGMELTVSVHLGANSCWGKIKVEDKLPPKIDCPADMTLDCYDTRTFSLPSAVDNCSTATVKELSNDVVDNACKGDTTAIRTIKYQAEDQYGNKSPICTRKIYYIKIGLGDITFPQNRDDVELPSLPCDNNENDPLTPPWDLNNDGYPQPNESGAPTTASGEPIYPNNSICELNATFTDQVIKICGGGPNGTSFKVLRQWVVLDWCTGNIEKDFQIIKVVDKDGPVLTCPVDDQIIDADPYSCSGTWIVPDPISIFDCSETTYTVGYLLADENGNPPVNGVYIDDNVVRINDNQGKFLRYEIRNLPVGRTWVRYTATDACGNVGRCFTEVDVVDNIPPVAVCDQFTVVTLTNNVNTQGVASAFAQTFDDGSHDNCTDVVLDVRRMTSGCGQSTTQYADRVNFCCADVGKSIIVELRVREKKADMSMALSNTCMVNVEVQDKTEPVITCPNNITINCTQDYKDLDITGRATAYDNCGTPTITNTDSGEPNQCGVGTITRTFIAKIGPATKTCTQRITIIDNIPFSQLNIDWSSVRDRTINGCMNIDTDPSVTGRPTWTTQSCSQIAASYKDQVFTLVDSVCFKILRTWTVIDWCEFNQNSPTSGGIVTRTQVIKVANSEGPKFTSCSDKMADGFGADCDGFITLENDATDDCTPKDKIKFSYRIDDFNDGTFGPKRNGKVASGVYPVGTHKIIWVAEDLCGNVSECEHLFTIKDKKKPTPYCLSEITTVVMPTSKMIDIWASDFDRGSFDNCPGELKLSFSSNVTDIKRVFTCDDLGINMLQMWVTDAAGNQDYCTVRINIQSNDGACDGSRIAGKLTTEDDKKVASAEIVLKNTSTSENMIVPTNAEGSYEFGGMASGSSYEISAIKNDNYLNGVSTLDLVIMQRHILGISKLNSPYKIIASDINNDQKVNVSDLVDLRKLILGINNKFPKNDSWRFAESSYVMSEPNHPWPFNEVIEVTFNGADLMNNNFKAIKIGDVNNSVKANARDNNIEPRSRSTFALFIDDVAFSKDELIRVPVTLAQAKEIFGFQFGLSFDDKALEFVGVEAKGIAMEENNLGLHNVDQGVIYYSWTNPQMADIEDNTVLFDIVFSTKVAGNLSGKINVDNSVMQAEAYDNELKVMDVSLDARSMAASYPVELFQNNPNPFDRSTSIRFTLPKDGPATIKIADVTGRIVYKLTDQFQKGENTVMIEADEIQSSGVLYYMLEVEGYSATKKMILIRK